jgi:hypothetical protein
LQLDAALLRTCLRRSACRPNAVNLPDIIVAKGDRDVNVPSLNGFRRKAAALLLLGGFCIAPSYAQSTFTADIGGLQLGMTPDQVRAALKAFDAGLKITEVSGYFTYSDGANHALQTPQFLDKLEAKPSGGYSTSFIVYFSTSTSDPRVIAVTRMTASQTPPTAAQFETSLQEKYGKPSARIPLSDLVWEEPGKPQCTRNINYKKEMEVNITGLTRETVPQYLQLRRRTAANKLPSDLTQCGAYLHVTRFNEDPVRRFNVVLIDLGAVMKSEENGSAWVEKLAAEAVAKRTAQGTVPKL